MLTLLRDCLHCCSLLLTCRPASALLHPTLTHSAGQWDNSLALVKWGVDWLVKAHVKASDTPADNAFVGQVRVCGGGEGRGVILLAGFGDDMLSRVRWVGGWVILGAKACVGQVGGGMILSAAFSYHCCSGLKSGWGQCRFGLVRMSVRSDSSPSQLLYSCAHAHSLAHACRPCPALSHLPTTKNKSKHKSLPTPTKQISARPDHWYFGRPEHATNPRPIYLADSAHPGADLAAEYAAAYSAGATLFKGVGQTAYAETLYKHAKQAYAFAKAYPSK